MKLWRSVLALSVAWMFITSSSLAQSTSPSPAESPTRTDGSTGVAPASSTPGTESSKPESSRAPAKRKGSARAAASREQVRAVQQALKDKGHDPGEIDGAMGPKTRAALRDFQKKEGLKVTGRIDSTTMAKLGIGGATTAGSASRPGMEVKPVVGEPSSGTASPVGASETPPTSASPPAGEPKK
jgi:peptidoglycan hydrolase-like protein with peptidoglycan-binding domain